MKKLVFVLVILLVIAFIFDVLILTAPKIDPGSLFHEEEIFHDMKIMNSTIVEHSFFSSSLGEERKYMVYLPENYTGEKQNILYMLHGRGGNRTSWIVKGNIKNILDTMIARNEIAPLIVVFMDCSGSEKEDYICFGNSTYLVEIIHDAENTYPVLKRGIGGLSYGATVAMEMVFDYNIFDSVATHSGSYGKVIKKIDNGSTTTAALYFDHGSLDFTPGYSKDKSEKLGEALARAGIEHKFFIYGKNIYDGGHTWLYWREHVRDALRFHDRAFKNQS